MSDFLEAIIINKLQQMNWQIIETPLPLTDLDNKTISAQKNDRIVHIELAKRSFIKNFYQILYHKDWCSDYNNLHLATTLENYNHMNNELMKRHIGDYFRKIIIINPDSTIDNWIE